MRTRLPDRGLLWITPLIGVAVYLRFWGLGSHPGFTGDEGRILLVAQAVGRGDWLAPSHLPSWIGPWLPWLLSPLTLITPPSPALARLLPTILSLTMLPLSYLLGARWDGPRLGLIAAALFACCALWIPWARTVNSVSLVPPAVLACLFIADRLARRPSPLRAASLGIALGLTVSLHLSAALLLPALACIHLNRRSVSRITKAPIALGLATVAFLVFVSPVTFGLASLFGQEGELAMRTQMDTGIPMGLFHSIHATITGFVAVLAGGASLEAFGGRTDGLLSLGRVGGVGSVLLLALGPLYALRRRDPLSRRLLLAVVVCLSIAALGSGDLDLRVQHRERYLFVPLVLTTLLAARGLFLLWGASASHGTPKMVPLLLGLLLGVQLLAVQVDWREPLKRGGSSESKIWWVGATGEAHESAAHWISSRLQPLEEGLLLCGDYWSLYSILPFLDRGPFDEGRLAFDYIHEPNSLLVSELRRTAHRRRFLVDHASGIWEAQIRTALPQLGLAHRDADYEVRTPDGRPILRVWELPPRPPNR